MKKVTIPRPTLNIINNILCCCFFLLFCSNSTYADWEQVMGPGGLPYGSIIHSFKNIIFVGTPGGLLKSTDGGKSWVKEKSQIKNYSINNISSIDSIIFVCSNGGIFRSADSGITWERVIHSKYDSSPFGPVLSFKGGLYVSTGKEILKSYDYGKKWVITNIFKSANDYNLNDRYYLNLKTLGNQLLTTVYDYSVYPELIKNYSTFDGNNWDYKFSKDSYYLKSLMGYLFYSKSKLLRSGNGGIEWEEKSDGLPENYYSMSVYTHTKTVYLITNKHGLYRSTNQGDSWHPSYIRDIDSFTIAKMESIGDDIYLFLYSNFSGLKNKVLKSSDDGLSWEYASYGINDLNTYFGDIIIINGRYLLFSGYCFYSSTNGKNWEKIEVPFDIFSVNSLQISGDKLIVRDQQNCFSKNIDSAYWKLEPQYYGNEVFSKNKRFIYSLDDMGEPGLFESKKENIEWKRVIGIDTFVSSQGFFFSPPVSVSAWNEYIYLYSMYSDKILQSSDEGGTWSTLNYPDSIIGGIEYPYKFIQYDSVIFISGRSRNSQGFITYRSSDNGATWKQSIEAAYMTRESKNLLTNYRNWSSDLNTSTDLGITWIKGRKIYNGQTMFCDDSVYLNYSDSIITISSDYASSWKITTKQIKGEILLLKKIENVYFILTQNQGGTQLFRSLNDKIRWIQIGSKLPISTKYGFPNSEIPNVKSGSFLYLGTEGGLFRINLNNYLMPQITTLFLGNRQYCAGDIIEVGFQVDSIITESLDSLSIELSDQYGEFDSPINLSIVGNGRDKSLLAKLPADVLESNEYRIRVVSKDTNILSTDNGHDIHIIPRVIPIIYGKDTVQFLEKEVIYSTEYEEGAEYVWEIVSGNAKIIQRSRNIVSLSFGPEGNAILRLIKTNKFGCTDEVNLPIIISSPSGITGEKHSLFSIYPNPTGESDQFLVRFAEIPNQDISIELLDILGSIHYSNTLQAGSETCIIPVQCLSSGMYMLRVRLNNEVFIEKVIVN